MTTEKVTGGKPPRQARLRLLLFTLLVGIAVTVGLVAIERIWHRRWEAEHKVLAIVDISEETTDPLLWGRNFPAHLQDYLRSDVSLGGWAGRAQRTAASESLQAPPDGYRVDRHYSGKRGHTYAPNDQTSDGSPSRAGPAGRCSACHDRGMPDYRAIGRAGGIPDALYEEQAKRGFDSLEEAPYGRGIEAAATAVRCIDCHEPGSLKLRVTRPEFRDAIRALAESRDSVPSLPSVARWRRQNQAGGYRPEAMASQQEMRILVCAQCHAGYYLDASTGTIAFPWQAGTAVESLEAYYEDRDPGYRTHPATGARLIEARQLQFELWSRGRHAEQRVSCTDCHMPYRRDGAVKITDHHLRSPRLNLTRACGRCHLTNEAELMSLVQSTQQRTTDLMTRAQRSLVALETASERARRAGAPETEMDEIRRRHRQAQWRLDLVMADGSLGFHAPGEALRILAEAIDSARQGEAAALGLLIEHGAGAGSTAPVRPGPAESR